VLVVEKAKALALKLNNPNRVLDVIPTAKTINVRGHDLVIAPHRLDEVRVLNNMGIKAPSPIMHYYDWPGRFTPFDHQKQTAAFLTLNNRGLVLNDIGTGKTQSALWAADYLIKTKQVKKVLILSPLSTLERVWGDGIFLGFPNRRFVVMHGTADRRRRLLKEDADFYIINHDGFSIIADDVHGMFDLVIVDEAAVLRNPSTQRFKYFRKWIGKNPETRLWLMTGTPTPNDPTDAWALAKLVDSPNCTQTFTAFRDQVMTKIGQWKFVPRPDSMEVVSHILQPSVRYTRDECFDLPETIIQTRQVDLTPEQAKYYKTMLKELVVDVTKTRLTGGTISAVNEAVKVQKLVQIACIAAGTDVLCARGWVPIQHVTPSDLVWDGCDWVSQGGAIYRGVKPTVTLDGVRMTRDHKVLTPHGWVQAGDILDAESCGGFARAEVRLPYSNPQGRNIQEQVRALGMSVRLRLGGHTQQPVFACEPSSDTAQLRVRSREPNTCDDGHTALPHLDAYETQVPRQKLQGLPQLGWTGYHRMSALANQLRGILGRYAAGIFGCTFPWSCRQRRSVRTRELSLGNAEPAGAEPAEAVYDLIECGPRSRFVVRGVSGTPIIVHNCGVAYGDDGQNIELDASPRVKLVKELIEEVGEKVIVFVPLTGTLHMLERELSKHWSVGVVNGQVSSNKRDVIFKDFQDSKDPHVLIAHPGTMAHGLTLTTASTIIWYGPVNSNETYVQANGRIERIGKNKTSNLIHIEATALEHKMYDRLRNKQSLQGLLLDLIQEQTRR
jgi:superfamily II DNA or RNA helicase